LLGLTSGRITQPRSGARDRLKDYGSDGAGVFATCDIHRIGGNNAIALVGVSRQGLANELTIAVNAGPGESGLNQGDANPKLPHFMIQRLGVALQGMFARGTNALVGRPAEIPPPN
jgi:hypothetical protein